MYAGIILKIEGAHGALFFVYMKKLYNILLLLFIIILFCSKSSAQKRTVICGQVKFNRKYIVHIFEPINGYYNTTSIDTLPQNSALVNGTDSLFKAILISEPTFIDIRFQLSATQYINRTDILLFPGDSVNLHFDLSLDNPNWVSYRGSNFEGQKFWNEINYQPYPKFALIINALNKLPANKYSFIKEVDDALSSNVKGFRNLQEQGKISKEFVQNIRLSLKMLYYNNIITKFIYDYPQRNVLSKSARDSIMDVFINDLPASNLSLKGLYISTLYLNSYYEYLTYKKLNLNKIEDLTSEDLSTVINKTKCVINKDFAIETYISDRKVQEDQWAIKLLGYFQLFPDNFDDDFIKQYNYIFPNNKWIKILNRAFPIATKKINYKLQSPIVFIDSSKSITSFDKLIREVPAGKPILVDCWATWCRPCLATFAYNKILDSLLNINNIQRLYVSIDYPQNRRNWEKVVYKYNLGGYHILASKDLIIDIKRTCGITDPETSPIMIPRYLLIDKNGIVLINNVAPPTDMEEFKKQVLGKF